MSLPHLPYDESDLCANPSVATLEARLRRLQKALAEQMVERRLDQDHIAALKLEVLELRETIAALEKALESAELGPSTRGRSI